VDDGTGIVMFQHHRHALLDGLKRFVIAAGSHGVASVTVILVAVRIPRTGAHALDQLRADAVALDRKGVIRVAYVDSFHLPEIALNILRVTGGRRKSFRRRAAHGLP